MAVKIPVPCIGETGASPHPGQVRPRGKSANRLLFYAFAEFSNFGHTTKSHDSSSYLQREVAGWKVMSYKKIILVTEKFSIKFQYL